MIKLCISVLLMLVFAMAPMAHDHQPWEIGDSGNSAAHVAHGDHAEACTDDDCPDQIAKKCCAMLAGHCSVAAFRSEGWSTMPLFWSVSDGLPCDGVLLAGIASEAETPPPRL